MRGVETISMIWKPFYKSKEDFPTWMALEMDSHTQIITPLHENPLATGRVRRRNVEHPITDGHCPTCVIARLVDSGPIGTFVGWIAILCHRFYSAIDAQYDHDPD